MRTRARAERAADLLAAAEDRPNGCATLAVPESRIKTLLSFLPQTGLTVQPGGGAAAPIPGALGALVPTRAVTLRGPAEALRAVAAWVAQPAGLV